MSTTNTSKPKRRYRRITPTVVSRYEGEVLLQGNNTAAIRVLEPDAKNPSKRAYDIEQKRNELQGAAYVERGLEQVAARAIDRVTEMVESSDERIATKNAHFVIDHVRGKAVQRNENRNINLNIQTVLE